LEPAYAGNVGKATFPPIELMLTTVPELRNSDGINAWIIAT